MASKKSVIKHISQETFDAAVEENIATFDMEREQAIDDAIEQFEAQGISLSNINIPGRQKGETENTQEKSEEKGPHIKDNRGYFFQSDADLKRQQEINDSVNYDRGEAVKLPCKALAMQVCPTDIAYIGEAGNHIRAINVSSGKQATIFSGHKGPVSAVLLAGDYLISGSWDKNIHVWNISDRTLVRTLTGHTDYVKCLAISGSTLYSGGMDRTLRMWDLNTGSLIRIFLKTIGKDHRRGVEAICVDEEGVEVYTACSDGRVRAFDCNTGSLLYTLEGHDTSVYALCLEEGFLYSGSADNTVKQWDIQQRKAIRTYRHKDWVRAVAVYGSQLITGSRDGIVRVWDIEDEHKCVKEYSGHFDTVESVQVTDGGRRIVSAGLDGTLRKWELV